MKERFVVLREVCGRAIGETRRPPAPAEVGSTGETGEIESVKGDSLRLGCGSRRMGMAIAPGNVTSGRMGDCRLPPECLEPSDLAL